jgi:hypothetical protein
MQKPPEKLPCRGPDKLQKKVYNHGRQVPEIRSEEIHAEADQNQRRQSEEKSGGGFQASGWKEEIVAAVFAFWFLRFNPGEPDFVIFQLPTIDMTTSLKLQQSQVWKQGEIYLRIVRVERLEVDYKEMNRPNTKKGTHHHVSKKEFCRLIKGATLMTEAEVLSAPPR